ncbi:MAG TPA: hypothetical protein VJZ27_05420, partial [Aggregatilineales bacterium]|nr:hypothetical protein [Aggregatilineales bacterium]
GDFLLKTADTGFSFPGHYLSFIDPESKALTILRLVLMDEMIDVFVENGDLKTDHSFYFGGFRFLTLRYAIERKSE